MRMTETRVAIGGLMRCCLGSLNRLAEDDPEVSEGDILGCDYCKSSMILEGGRWRWHKEEREELDAR